MLGGRMTFPHRIRTHPPTLLLLGLLLQVGASFLPDPLPRTSQPTSLAGGALIVLGIVANVVAVRRFERARTPVSPTGAPRVLVTDGLFAWTRNPMYLGLASILFGTALALQSLWAAVPAIAIMIQIDRLIGHEEVGLERHFGTMYSEYRRRTARWL